MIRPTPLFSEPLNDRAATARGAPGRVVEAHAQTRSGLLIAAVFVVAAVVAGVTGVGAGWWLPLHLFVVGGLLSAISAATQMLAVTWSAAPATRPALAAGQRWLLAVGATALVAGRETERTWMFVAGGMAVVVAMLGLASMLIRIRLQAVTPRFVPAIEVYVVATLAGATGMTIGILLGAGRAVDSAVELRNVHLVLNVFGLIGLVIAGTLPFFAATQVRSKMSPRATPVAMRVTFATLTTAVVVAAIGHLVDRPGVVAGGLITYVVGLVSVATMLPIYARKRLQWAGPRLVQLLAGVAWWAAMTLALAVTTIRGTADRAILQALVIGGLAQILVASLAYLGPVLRGGGHQSLTAGFVITRSWLSPAAGNVAGLAALVGHRPTLAAALAIWLVDITTRGGRLLTTTVDHDKE